MNGASSILVGVDVGGTFTDCVVCDPRERSLRLAKVASTLEDQSDGVARALEMAWPDEHWRFGKLVHGSTVATNAVIERRGATLALVTTAGFRDIIELRRRDRPHLFGLGGTYEPLIPRELLFTLSERVTTDGEVEVAVDAAELDEVGRSIAVLSVDAVVVSFMNAYANPTNERAAVRHLRRLLPDLYIVSATEINAEWREFERTSTAAVNAYVQPEMERYLKALEQRVARRGEGRNVWVIQSSGGHMSLDAARQRPVVTVLSGPAAGVVAGQYVALLARRPHAVTMDMGGTSLDLGVIVDGRAGTTDETSVTFGIPVRLPMIDIHAIGAGGGSIAGFDAEGLLSIGPRSAGSRPGPCCYGRGGVEPTLTDANVVLGRLGASSKLGSDADLRIRRDLAERSMEALGERLGLDTTAVAAAILEVAVAKLSDAIKLVTIERGHDPAEFALIAFGGAGPLHACAILRQVPFIEAIVPPLPGMASAMGCLLGDVRHDYVETVGKPLDEDACRQLRWAVTDHAERGRRLLESEGMDLANSFVEVEAEMNYRPQTHSITVPLRPDGLTEAAMRDRFEETYRRRFGRVFDETEIVLLTVRTRVVGQDPAVMEALQAGAMTIMSDSEPSEPAWRTVVTSGGRGRAAVEDRAAVLDRRGLRPGDVVEGPAIVEQLDSTCLVEAGFTALVDDHANLRIRRSGAEDGAPMPEDLGRLDETTLSVIRGALRSAANEMDAVLRLTAFSPVLAEGADSASGIYSPTGDVIAQGEQGLPLFVGNMQFAVAHVADTAGSVSPGDVFVVNDPYPCGSHLMDVKMVAPVFVGDRLQFFVANTGHWSDIGGGTPGGFNPDATDIYQEGIRIPTTKLVEWGRLLDPVVNLLLANMRVPSERHGDLNAQLNALERGHRRVTEICERFGAERVVEATRLLADRAEAAMRRALSELPAGTYHYEDVLDNDGVDPEPVRIRLALTIGENEVTFDFSGSSARRAGPMNNPNSNTRSACYIALKHIFPDVPVNGGSFRPVRFRIPADSCLDAKFPAPVGGASAEMTQRIIDVCFGALAEADPTASFAQAFSTSSNLAIGGTDPATGRDYVVYIYLGGGLGAHARGDGLSNASATHSGARVPPMEVIERNYPFRVRRYELREGSGGPGRYRGGLGVRLELELVRGTASASLLADRSTVGPSGIAGGGSGAPSRYAFIRADGTRYVPPMVSKAHDVVLGVGDRICVETPGGGGYGEAPRVGARASDNGKAS